MLMQLLELDLTHKLLHVLSIENLTYRDKTNYNIENSVINDNITLSWQAKPQSGSGEASDKFLVFLRYACTTQITMFNVELNISTG